MEIAQRYYLRPAAAFVRGSLEEEGPLFEKELDELVEEEQEALFLLGKEAGLKMHRFKRARELPRVAKVLGLLRGLQVEDLLDIGTGRGVFLWPFLDEFRGVPVHCLDILPYRVRDLQAVGKGGVKELSADLADIREYSAPPQ